MPTVWKGPATWQEIERNYIIDSGATMTATSSQSAFPISNLLTYSAWQVWRSNTIGAQTLQAQQVGILAPNCVFLVNHNYTAAGWGSGGTNPTLQYSTNGSTWTTLMTLNFQNDFDGTLVGDDEAFWQPFPDGNGDGVPDSITSKQYWRINWSNSSGKPQIGVWGLGRLFAYRDADLGGGSFQWDYQIRERKTETGARFLEQTGRRLHTIKKKRSGQIFSPSPYAPPQALFSPIADIMAIGAPSATGTYNLHQGSLRPMVYVWRPDNVFNDGLGGRCLYMRYASVVEATERFSNVYDDEVVLIEEAW